MIRGYAIRITLFPTFVKSLVHDGYEIFHLISAKTLNFASVSDIM